MNYQGKSEEVLSNILKAFESGNIPKPLAQVFIRRNDPEIPCHRWSFINQMIAIMRGHADARGFRQWQEAGRHVKKGEKSFFILGPIQVKVNGEKGKRAEEDEFKLIGFKSIPVFGLDQTEGKPIPRDKKAEAFLDSLPLVEVARAWGLKVTSYNGENSTKLGCYTQVNTATETKGISIAIGVENLSTWAHEMIHAADDRAGNLTEHGKKHNELVAELGGAVLLECLGLSREADIGGCWSYINNWSPEDPIKDCLKVINRVTQAIDLILTTAEQLKTGQAA